MSVCLKVQIRRAGGSYPGRRWWRRCRPGGSSCWRRPWSPSDRPWPPQHSEHCTQLHHTHVPPPPSAVTQQSTDFTKQKRGLPLVGTFPRLGLLLAGRTLHKSRALRRTSTRAFDRRRRKNNLHFCNHTKAVLTCDGIFFVFKKFKCYRTYNGEETNFKSQNPELTLLCLDNSKTSFTSAVVFQINWKQILFAVPMFSSIVT